ncbi:MAG: reverse transcriptase/maturase family protein [Defluviitaleaceae bacterium]|nr:reverse transcriptase/maturase family protein [Defluviitaleaceae bacterium]MCL2835789.1 reverse transcriptase/maturase family protein [Defluviitaleaceae bacterium]
MKRIGNIYEKIYHYDNCKRAIYNASYGKRTRKDVKPIFDNIGQYAAILHKMLKNQTYKPTLYRNIVINDRLQGKQRETQVPAFFPDLCVQHALLQVLAPILEKRMYHWSCGSRPNKGTSHAKKGVERATLQRRNKAKYAVKLDIKKCYPTIANDPLMRAFERLIKDKRALWLIDKIVRSCEGLPIGNYTSAWFCNFYLTPIDNLLKETHKVNFYIRYIDDMVLIDSNKRKLKKAVKDVEARLAEMGLSIHPNWNIFRIRKAGNGYKDRPIDFVGFCFSLGYTTQRRRNALSLMRHSRRIAKIHRAGRVIPHKLAAGFLARAGQLRHFKSQGLKRKYVDTLPLKIIKGVVRNESKRKSSTVGGI